MRSIIPFGGGFLRLFVGLLTFVMFNSDVAAAEADDIRLLLSELPPGTILRAANPEQVITATRKSVRREPRQTVGIVRVAILSRVPPRRPIEGKNVVDRSKEAVCPPCKFVLGVAQAAIRENPAEASGIIEEASILCPSCAGDLEALLSDPGLALGGTDDFPIGNLGFGFGLGPGFPGGPPQMGSNTGGVLSLPPVGNPVTTIANN